MSTIDLRTERGRNNEQSSHFEQSFQIIRSETVLSRLPIHNLAKKGRVQIEIKRKIENGETELLWEVSYNERHGQPRQLAYKIDTLLVNRKIDEGGRPIPKHICLGSLSEMCRFFNLAESGENVKGIKRALLQNASAFINAKLKYKSSGGIERKLEAGFSRYSVFFTGQRLPDGSRAEGVYLLLNDPYREVLNHSPVRPLNYDYLRELSPTAQRFYEIISYKIFAALKHRHSEAKLTYSDYCTYSAQQRHYDYDHVKKQMYKIHHPHLQSGYLAFAQFKQTEDSEGRPDWQIIYTPGMRAQGEYIHFNRKDNIANRKKQTIPCRSPHSTINPEVLSEGEAQLVDIQLLQALTSRGITEGKARQLLANVSQGQCILQQLSWGDYLIAQSPPEKYRNPPGLYIHLLKKNVAVPADFKGEIMQSGKQFVITETAIASEADKELREAYLHYQKSKIERFIDESMSEKERIEFSDRVNQTLEEQYSYVAEWPEPQAKLALQEVTYSALKDKVPIISFEEFCSSNSPWERILAVEKN